MHIVHKLNIWTIWRISCHCLKRQLLILSILTCNFFVSFSCLEFLIVISTQLFPWNPILTWLNKPGHLNVILQRYMTQLLNTRLVKKDNDTPITSQTCVSTNIYTQINIITYFKYARYYIVHFVKYLAFESDKISVFDRLKQHRSI